jgi:hypothetical protein
MDDSKTDGESSQTTRRSSPLFWVVSILFLGYAILLIVLAILTSNPILFSPRQLQQSDLIVHGKVISIDEGGVTFHVEEVFRGENVPESIRVSSLNPESLAAGQEWLVPLRIVGSEEYRVTPLNSDRRNQPTALIYPADPSSIANLKSRLSSGELSP